MRLLLDTHLLLWASEGSPRLSRKALELITDEDNVLMFSAISLAEIAIKSALRRPDFEVEPGPLRRGLIDNGYIELALTGEHAIAVAGLPAIHKDPFDRLLVAQAMIEGVTLVTVDAVVGQYPGPVRVV